MTRQQEEKRLRDNRVALTICLITCVLGCAAGMFLGASIIHNKESYMYAGLTIVLVLWTATAILTLR